MVEGSNEEKKASEVVEKKGKLINVRGEICVVAVVVFFFPVVWCQKASGCHRSAVSLRCFFLVSSVYTNSPWDRTWGGGE